jgi:hypothetical protein
MSAPSQQSVFPKSHVGFDSITTQIEKKLLKRGFQFNVICVGMADFSALQRVVSSERRKLTFHVSDCRPDWSGQEHLDQHHFRVAPRRLQGPHGAR